MEEHLLSGVRIHWSERNAARRLDRTPDAILIRL
jgi:hypothetical protein